jgi:hypothetical protein
MERRSFNPIPSIVWASDSRSGRADWTIGFYDRDEMPGDFIVDADGIELVIEHQWREALNGASLDLVNGFFSIQGAREVPR